MGDPDVVEQDGTADRGPTRRRVLVLGLGGAAAFVVAGAGGVELVSHGVLPGRQLLDRIRGTCAVPSPRLEFAAAGPSIS